MAVHSSTTINSQKVPFDKHVQGLPANAQIFYVDAYSNLPTLSWPCLSLSQLYHQHHNHKLLIGPFLILDKKIVFINGGMVSTNVIDRKCMLLSMNCMNVTMSIISGFCSGTLLICMAGILGKVFGTIVVILETTFVSEEFRSSSAVCVSIIMTIMNSLLSILVLIHD